MKLSELGLNFIKARESFRTEAYKDGAGIWTYGYGSIFTITGKKVKEGDTISPFRATVLLIKVADQVSEQMDDLTYPNLEQCQFDALTSFCYNLGIPAYKISTLRKVINQTAVDAKLILTPNLKNRLREEFCKWNKYHTPDGKLLSSDGLLNRRIAEWRMFCGE